MAYERSRESKIRYKRIVKRLLKAADAEERALAAHELRHYRESSIVKPLLQALQDPSPQVRWQALQSLRQRYYRLERFAKYIIPLLEDDVPQVQVAVVDGLFEMIDPASMQAILFDVLERDDLHAQLDAIALLPGVISVKGAQAEPIIGFLLNLLDADPLQLRMAATQAVGDLRVDAATPKIIRNVLYAGDLDASAIAIRALGSIGTREAVDVLLQWLEGEQLLDEVANALGMAGDRRAVKPLIASLQRDPRMSYVEALGRLGDAQAVEPLAALLHQSGHWPEIVSPILSALRLIDSPAAHSLLAKYQ